MSEDGEKKTYYISPKEFKCDLKDYYDISIQVEQWNGEKDTKDYRKLLRKQKKLLDKCGLYIYKLVIGLSNHPKYSGYTWRDEMVADALSQCNKALIGRKFKLDMGFNPFSYYTMISAREFIHRIKVEKKKVDIHNKYITEHSHDFTEECDTPIYVKPSFASQLGEFYDVEREVTYNDIENR